jgi:hypothetical protein
VKKVISSLIQTTTKPAFLSVSTETIVKHLSISPSRKAESQKPKVGFKVLQKIVLVKATTFEKTTQQ